MPHPLAAFARWFPAQQWPPSPCPTCGVGFLVTTEEGRPSHKESSASRAQSERDRDPMMMSGRFTGWLQCASCGEQVAVAGDWSVDYDVIAGVTLEYGSYYDAYMLRHVSPALRLVSCPDRTPEKVRAAVEAAGALVWLDPAAAANRLRLATEEFLTAMRIPRTSVARGRRHRLKTHQRIDQLLPDNADLRDALMAVKWIGNEGSHSQLDVAAVLEGAQMFEHALSLRYGGERDRIIKRIKEVNQRNQRKPRKPRKP